MIILNESAEDGMSSGQSRSVIVLETKNESRAVCEMLSLAAKKHPKKASWQKILKNIEGNLVCF
jgi:hypothetical protein